MNERCLQRTAKAVQQGNAVIDRDEAAKWCGNCRFIFDSLFESTALDNVPIGEALKQYPCTKAMVNA